MFAGNKGVRRGYINVCAGSTGRSVDQFETRREGVLAQLLIELNTDCWRARQSPRRRIFLKLNYYLCYFSTVRLYDGYSFGNHVPYDFDSSFHAFHGDRRR